FANILGQVPRASEVNHGSPLAMGAAQSRRTAYALPSPREKPNIPHALCCGGAGGGVPTKQKYPWGKVFLWGEMFFLCLFSFSAFPMGFLFTLHMAVAERLYASP
ncbi:uncharacterized protein TM35_000521410, partial [Trypanosoma theileri]